MLTKTGTCPACETEDVTLTAEWRGRRRHGRRDVGRMKSMTRMAWDAYRELVRSGADRERARGIARRYLLALQRIDAGGQI